MNLIKEHKYIDTMMFEVGATYYIKVSDAERREALIVCISRSKEKAEFLRIFDISGKWLRINYYVTIDSTYTEEFDNIIIKKVIFNDVYDPLAAQLYIRINLE